MQGTSFMRTARGTVLAAAALVSSAGLSLAQSVPVVTGDARVDKLLSQMTLKEKLTLIHGTHEDPAVYQGQAGYLGGVPRLNIPGLRFADGPPGVLTRHPRHLHHREHCREIERFRRPRRVCCAWHRWPCRPTG